MTARRNLVLLVVVVALLVAATAGGWLSWRMHRDRAATAERQRQYGDVIAAATSHAHAVANLRHDDAGTLEAARAGATGELRDEYGPEGEVRDRILKDGSVFDGSVTWAGVTEVGGGTATALVATTGTVTSRLTDGEAAERTLRLRIELVRSDGEWLANDVELVE